MKLFKILALACFALLSGSCAPTQAMLVKQSQVAETIPTCSDDRDCDRKWVAAQAFVTQNSGFRIQTATDAIIETFGPTTAVAFAFNVVKEPIVDAGYRFLVTVYCGNIFGCGEDPWDVALRFNNYLNQLSDR